MLNSIFFITDHRIVVTC